MFGPSYSKSAKQTSFPKHNAFRPVANEHDAGKQDSSMLAVAGGIATGRGESDTLSKEAVYRRMEQKQRININKFGDSHGSQHKLMNFYEKQMGGVYDAKQMSKMYGIYQDNGEEKMFETIRPMNLQKGDMVYNNLIGEIGVLQDAQPRGQDVMLIFQDRSFRVTADAHGWSKKKLITTDESAPVAASSAAGPALFKEQVDESTKNNPKNPIDINGTMQKIIAEVEHQDDVNTLKQEHQDLMKGMSAEKEHIDLAKKIWDHKITPEKAPLEIAKDHEQETPGGYYKFFNPNGKGKEFLVKQDDSEDEDEDNDEDFEEEEEEFADDNILAMVEFAAMTIKDFMKPADIPATPSTPNAPKAPMSSGYPTGKMNTPSPNTELKHWYGHQNFNNDVGKVFKATGGGVGDIVHVKQLGVAKGVKPREFFGVHTKEGTFKEFDSTKTPRGMAKSYFHGPHTSTSFEREVPPVVSPNVKTSKEALAPAIKEKYSVRHVKQNESAPAKYGEYVKDFATKMSQKTPDTTPHEYYKGVLAKHKEGLMSDKLSDDDRAIKTKHISNMEAHFAKHSESQHMGGDMKMFNALHKEETAHPGSVSIHMLKGDKTHVSNMENFVSDYHGFTQKHGTPAAIVHTMPKNYNTKGEGKLSYKGFVSQMHQSHAAKTLASVGASEQTQKNAKESIHHTMAGPGFSKRYKQWQPETRAEGFAFRKNPATASLEDPKGHAQRITNFGVNESRTTKEKGLDRPHGILDLGITPAINKGAAAVAHVQQRDFQKGVKKYNFSQQLDKHIKAHQRKAPEKHVEKKQKSSLPSTPTHIEEKILDLKPHI